jgi:hypothetical protein
MPYTPEEVARAGEAARNVRNKAVAALRPIQREMQIMGWGPQLRAIMWGAVLRLALDRMVDALAESGGPVSGRRSDGAGQDVSNDSELQRSCPADPRSGSR